MSSATASSVLPQLPRRPAALVPPIDPSKRLVDEHRRKVRAARQAAELELIEWSQILHRKLLDRALDPKTDPKLATDISFRLIDRGIGKVREVESETAEDKRRSLDPNNILDVLAALSTQASASQQQQRLERDVSGQTISTEDAAIKFLDELQDGQVIDHEEGTEND
ncbi:hypothetical protein [Pseudomonas asiatica]|uniref:hypothetical protein n=1 Tax=Pseudomonas asiatica TaxID=2219225 RepID=UPI0018D7008A|nr:hypothetical protein [Pseudomonas asiatica]MBH3378360.1 hypothetical protein [Pseudomonas asiatica]